MRWGVLLAGAAALLVGGASGEGRHEYKLSFKSPVLFGEGHFPHFSSEGDSLVSVDSVRLVPSVQSKRGSVWSETPLPFDQWQVVLAFSISGRGRLGGDGMALWYVSEHLPLGSAMGARETFKGLMIPFDTYDNDNKRNNPHVGAIINDGSVTFNPETDGFEIMKAGCIKNIRNTPTPVHARITYRDSTLTVELDTSERGNSYATCFSVSDVHLPKGYYFGLSAATGGLADDHDVVSFEVYNLNPPPRSPSKKAPTKIDQEDQQQFDKIREQVQEMRAKNEPPIQLDEGYQLLLGKLSTVEELLSDLEKLGRGQQDLRDSLETVALSIGSQKRELENKERSNSPRGNHRQQPNEAASMIQSIVHRLEDVETELSQKAAALTSQSTSRTNQASGGSPAVFTGIANIERTLKSMESRLARLEAQKGKSQIVASLREDINRFKASGGFPEDGEGGSWIFVAIFGVVGIAVPVVYYLTKKPASKKFI